MKTVVKTRTPKAPRKKRSSLFPESQVQKGLLEWLRLQYPTVRPYIIKLNNEGRRSASSNALIIQLGLHVGASDLFLAYPSGKFHGLFLEIKREKWKLTESQKEHFGRQLLFIERMKSVGYEGAVGVGFDECQKIILNYLKT